MIKLINSLLIVRSFRSSRYYRGQIRSHRYQSEALDRESAIGKSEMITAESSEQAFLHRLWAFATALS